MNSFKIDRSALKMARKQFCLDIELPWEEYMRHPEQKVFIRKADYRPGTMLVESEGARNYEGRNDFFHAMICMGQLFLVVDERIYDWAADKFADAKPEWFCEYGNLRMIDEKLREYGQQIRDTHVYFLPEDTASDKAAEKALTMQAAAAYEETLGCCEGVSQGSGDSCSFAPGAIGGSMFRWYDQEEILKFREGNRFTSAICFSRTQPDMIAVAAFRDTRKQQDSREDGMWRLDEEMWHDKVQRTDLIYDQSCMCGMAGVSADGKYLWQIGINVDGDAAGKGLATALVTALKEEIIRRGKVPFYGTSESHTISRTVALKAGFVPAWTEIYAGSCGK